jgi:hypothetical protein
MPVLNRPTAVPSSLRPAVAAFLCDIRVELERNKEAAKTPLGRKSFEVFFLCWPLEAHRAAADVHPPVLFPQDSLERVQDALEVLGGGEPSVSAAPRVFVCSSQVSVASTVISHPDELRSLGVMQVCPTCHEELPPGTAPSSTEVWNAFLN